MAIDFDKLERLRVSAASLGNEDRLFVCEVLAVYWTDSITKYYAISAFDEQIPFRSIPASPINPVLKGKVFQTFALNSDLTTESISLTFSDTDKSLENLFATYGEGVRCELFYYYPKIDDTNGDDLFISVWWGHFMTPEFIGRGVLQIQAENGFKSRELLMGHRIRPKMCTQVFGGQFTDINEYRGNGCIYNRQLGGTSGNLNAGVPYATCDKTEGNCADRLGVLPNLKAKYWMGFDTDVQTPTIDHGGYIAPAKGGASGLKDPIRVVAGAKYVQDLLNIFYRKELNTQHPEEGFVRGIWEISEGPVDLLDEIVINDKIIETEHIQYRTGELGQSQTSYAQNISGFSGTAVVNAAYGKTNAATTELASLKTRIKCRGYNKVRVYSDETTFTSIGTNKRIWWLMELYSNMRFGRGYRHNKFHIAEMKAIQDILDTYIIHTDPNGTQRHTKRDQFDAIMDGRPTQETILDICRSGRISVPYQWDSKYTISALTKWNDLGSVRVFSDRYDDRNIIPIDKIQTIKKFKIPDSKLVNKVVLTYEDGTKFDRERPLVFIDEVQMKKASGALGLSSFNEIEKRYKSFGLRFENPNYKLGWSLLQLGEFDTGGTENNLRLQFPVHFEQAIGLRKFEVINVDSDLLDNEDFSYFRVQGLNKTSDHKAMLTVQAYPETFYETFETIDADPPPDPDDFPTWHPPICDPLIGGINYTNGFAEIPIDPCD